MRLKWVKNNHSVWRIGRKWCFAINQESALDQIEIDAEQTYIYRSKFVGEIQAMIDNDSSKSNRSIARDIGVSKFLIRRLMRENIQYFPYKMRKIQFLSNVQGAVERETNKTLCRTKYKLKARIMPVV